MKHGGVRKGAGRPSLYNEKTKPVRLPITLIPSVQNFIEHRGYFLPFYSSRVSTGFPSPAEDYIAENINLNEYLIKNPASTFLVRSGGDALSQYGIQQNDILVVDRSMEPTDGHIVVAALQGTLMVKRLSINNDKMYLTEKDNSQGIEIQGNGESPIWGVVTNVIHQVI